MLGWLSCLLPAPTADWARAAAKAASAVAVDAAASGCARADATSAVAAAATTVLIVGYDHFIFISNAVVKSIQHLKMLNAAVTSKRLSVTSRPFSDP